MYLSNSMAFSFPVRFMSTEWHWNKGRQSGHHICIARNLGRWSRMEGKHPKFADVCACHRRIPHNCYMVCLIKNTGIIYQVPYWTMFSEDTDDKTPQTINFLSLIYLEHVIVKTSQSIKHCRNSNALAYRGAEWTERLYIAPR